jgi:hypothetical protein
MCVLDKWGDCYYLSCPEFLPIVELLVDFHVKHFEFACERFILYDYTDIMVTHYVIDQLFKFCGQGRVINQLEKFDSLRRLCEKHDISDTRMTAMKNRMDELVKEFNILTSTIRKLIHETMENLIAKQCEHRTKSELNEIQELLSSI